MPALPWVNRHPIDPNAEYLAMASRLPLHRYQSVLGFLRDSLAIRRQLAKTPGLVGYAPQRRVDQEDLLDLLGVG